MNEGRPGPEHRRRPPSPSRPTPVSYVHTDIVPEPTPTPAAACQWCQPQLPFQDCTEARLQQRAAGSGSGSGSGIEPMIPGGHACAQAFPLHSRLQPGADNSLLDGYTQLPPKGVHMGPVKIMPSFCSAALLLASLFCPPTSWAAGLLGCFAPGNKHPRAARSRPSTVVHSCRLAGHQGLHSSQANPSSPLLSPLWAEARTAGPSLALRSNTVITVPPFANYVHCTTGWPLSASVRISIDDRRRGPWDDDQLTYTVFFFIRPSHRVMYCPPRLPLPSCQPPRPRTRRNGGWWKAKLGIRGRTRSFLTCADA